MPLFLRQYRLLIGRPATTPARPATASEPARPASSGNTGFEINENRIKFFITKTLSRNPNKNEIQIWNLKEATRRELEKKDVICYLYAGYEESTEPSLIFQGNVTFTYTTFDLPDVITTFELGDGFAQYRDTTISLGYQAGVSSRTIIEDIAKKMGFPLHLGQGVDFYEYPNGFAYFGAAREALTKACNSSGLTWSTQNGVLQVVKRGGSNSRAAIVLSASSGLVGTPQREKENASQVAKVQDQDTGRNKRIVSAQPEYEGWRTTSLLMPTIIPGDQVKLESRSSNSVLIASEVTHKGDNFEGDWHTEMKLVDSRTASKIREEEAKRAAAEKKAAATARTRAKPETPVAPAPIVDTRPRP